MRSIYEDYLNGKGFDSIARSLSKNGVPSPSQVAKKKNARRFWHGSSISKILTNPHYTGDLVQGRETKRSVTSSSRHSIPKEQQIVVKHTHHSIIPHALFNTVQELIKSRKKNRTKAKKHLFTNVLYCGDCGTGMWYRQNREVYICGYYARHGKIACTHRTIKEEDLEKIIIHDLNKMARIINDKDHLSSLEVESQSKKKYLTKSLQQIETEIQSAKTKKGRSCRQSNHSRRIS
ncbi:recombinase family protein [Paenibacillus sp. TAF43_2]|uniref:recombinase family protein n=1 Tax=Paenibacillus sp. TAF43_2 TaxID=3233069 RepID=UPI003F95C2AA